MNMIEIARALRAMGFATEDDSRQFCTALLKGNATCIPVLHR